MKDDASKLLWVAVVLFLAAMLATACGEDDDQRSDGDQDRGEYDLEDGDSEESAEQAVAPDAAAWGAYAIGSRVVDLVDAGRENRPLPTLIVYPAQGTPAKEQSKPQAVKDAEPERAEAPYPVVIFSHGSGSSKENQMYFLNYLASHGYVVVAMDHTGNVGVSAMYPEDLAMTVVRDYDVAFVIDQALTWFADKNDPLFGLGDPARMGMAGHSYGGHIALAFGGAAYDYAHILEQCTPPATPEDPYVCPLTDAKEGLKSILPDSRIKAVISFAHDASRFYFGQDLNGIAQISAPTFYFSGDKDSYSPPAEHSDPCFTTTTATAYHLNFPEGGHMGFTDYFNEGALKLDRMHAIIQRYGAAFFGYHLKGIAKYGELLRQDPAQAWGESMDEVEWEWKPSSTWGAKPTYEKGVLLNLDVSAYNFPVGEDYGCFLSCSSISFKVMSSGSYFIKTPGMTLDGTMTETQRLDLVAKLDDLIPKMDFRYLTCTTTDPSIDEEIISGTFTVNTGIVQSFETTNPCDNAYGTLFDYLMHLALELGLSKYPGCD